MTIFGPGSSFLFCREIKKGFGYRHQCLGSNFRISTDGALACDSCGKIYESFEALQTASMVDTEQSLFEERLAVNG
jgi:rRNA maturation endonuclease Nob1